jgi:hypothetical protein
VDSKRTPSLMEEITDDRTALIRQLDRIIGKSKRRRFTAQRILTKYYQKARLDQHLSPKEQQLQALQNAVVALAEAVEDEA